MLTLVVESTPMRASRVAAGGYRGGKISTVVTVRRKEERRDHVAWAAVRCCAGVAVAGRTLREVAAAGVAGELSI